MDKLSWAVHLISFLIMPEDEPQILARINSVKRNYLFSMLCMIWMGTSYNGYFSISP